MEFKELQGKKAAPRNSTTIIKGRAARRLIMFSLIFHTIVCKFQINCKSNEMADSELVNICRIIFLDTELLLFVGLEKVIAFLISKYMFVFPGL